MSQKNSPLEVVSNQGAEENTNDGISAVIITTDGLEQAIRNSASDWWHGGAMLAIKQLALSGRGFDVDHIRDLAGEPEDPHYWGAVFASAQKLKVIEAVGARIGRDGKLRRIWWGVPQ
jgi:hypothetical protein